MARVHSLSVRDKFYREIARRKDSPGEVLMVVRRPGGKVLVTTKGFYPEGVYRLPTGKMHPGETPEAGFRREVYEETGFATVSGEPMGEIQYALTHGADTADYRSFVFLTPETTAEPIPVDEDEGISGYREISPSELHDIAEQLRHLDAPWDDWGRFRAIAHDWVASELESRGLLEANAC